MRWAILFALIAALAAPERAPGEPLGRLFFTPAQRSALDEGKRLAVTSAPTASKPPTPRGPASITLSGVVRRSDGEHTVWVNGRAVGKGGPPGVSAVPSANHPAAALVKLRGASAPVELRVGQQAERSTGSVSENLLRRPSAPGLKPKSTESESAQ